MAGGINQKSIMLIGIGCLTIWIVGILWGLQDNKAPRHMPSSKPHLRPIELEPLSVILQRQDNSNTTDVHTPLSTQVQESRPPARNTNNVLTQAPKRIRIPETLISRHSGVTATCDRRGNLGPCQVVVQDVPGTDWLKDRWQAASDMGGTAIPGAHWIVLDFHRLVKARRFILDWETAYAEDYRLEGRMNLSDYGSVDKYRWDLIYDNALPAQQRSGTKHSESTGQSPGVKKQPLHVIHTIQLYELSKPFVFLRLFIRRPAMHWGVSLWQFDVFGEEKDS